MRLAMMVALQVAGPPVPADLRPAKPAAAAVPCGEPDAAGDVVVCGRGRDADRLRPVDPDRYADKPVRAATRIGNARLVAEAEQGTLPNGQSAPRAMLRLKLPF